MKGADVICLWSWCDLKIIFQRKNKNCKTKIKQYLLEIFNLYHHWKAFHSEFFLLFTEKINNPADTRNQEHKAEEEDVSSQLKSQPDLLKPAVVHKEMLPESQKELNPPEYEKRVIRQDALQVAEGQAASEEIEREDLLNDDAKQDDLTPEKAG